MMDNKQWHWQWRVTDGYGTYLWLVIAPSRHQAREQAEQDCGSFSHFELVRNWLR